MVGEWWTRARNYLYDKRLVRSAHASCFVLSIGNLSWGGTGKTQLVAQLGRFLIEQGCRVAILSRGYGRSTRGFLLVTDGASPSANWRDVGDEAYLLAQVVPSAIIAVSESRAVALPHIQRYRPNVILLDDAFQHRRINRDLDVVMMDGSENWAAQKVIPFGKLRESGASLRRADAIVITHSKKCTAGNLEWLSNHTSAPLFSADYIAVATPWAGRKIAAFCGIGAPHHFIELLRNKGAEIVHRRSFPDHHIYTYGELKDLQTKAIIAGADALVTTQKDAIKIDHSWLQLPLFVVDSKVAFDDGEAFYHFALDRIAAYSTALK